jgi:hypothetical protein
VVLED